MNIIPSYSQSQKAMELKELKSLQELEGLQKESTDKCLILLFWASWHEPCTILRDILSELVKTQQGGAYPHMKLSWCDSDSAADIVDKIDISSVPALAVFHPFKNQPDIIENPSPDVLNNLIETQNEYYQKQLDFEKKKAFLEIETMVKSWPFFAFIKGTPEQPRCKFTRRLVEMFAKFQYKYKTFDILEDERVRQWLKHYSNWPTFPQVYLNGTFAGGVDVITELVESNEFDEMVPTICKKQTPKEELSELLSQNKVVAFIRGTIDLPVDQESQQLMQVLKDKGIKFAAVNISQKQEYLEVLKERVPGIEMPTIFVKGECLGSVSKVLQLYNQGGLMDLIPAECVALSLQGRIEKLLKSHKIVLFMKGNPAAPACGFSQRMVGLLRKYDGLDYQYFDILQDQEIREGLKAYSNWPTYPQLYVKGQLVGGIDVVEELHAGNELEAYLQA